MKTLSRTRGTVLIVDDDPAVLILIHSMLTAAGYRVLHARGRADAVRLAWQKHIRIDLVLLDVYLPGVSGTELAEEILSIRPDIRVLWMSGFVDEGFIRIQPAAPERDGLLTAVERCA